MPDAAVTFTVRGADCLDDLEPLWLALFDHHRSVGDAGLPIIDRVADLAATPPYLRGDSSTAPTPSSCWPDVMRQPVGYAMCHLHRSP